MLYDMNSSPVLPRITQALRNLGASEEVLTVLAAYMDLSQPRNNALLDQITPTRFTPPSNRDFFPLQHAIQDELEKKYDAEAMARWYLFCDALCREYSMEIGMWAGYNRSWQEWHDSVLEALRSRWGDTAEARHAVVMLSRRSIGAPELCAAAMQYTHDTEQLLMLCMAILDQSDPANKKDPSVQTALVQLEKFYQDWNAKSNLTGHFLVAMALAAHFSETWHRRFVERMTQKPAYSVAAKPLAIAELAFRQPVIATRVVQSLAEIPCDAEYIVNIAMAPDPIHDDAYRKCDLRQCTLPDRDAQLRILAERYPETFCEAMRNFAKFEPILGYYQENKIQFPARVKHMQDILHEVHPEIDFGTELIDRAQQVTAYAICRGNEDYAEQFKAFLFGTAGFDTITPLIPKLTRNHYHYTHISYIGGYGLDDFAERCICLQAVLQPGNSYAMVSVPDYKVRGHQAECIGILRRHEVPLCHILSFCGNLDPEIITVDAAKGLYENALIKTLLPFRDEIAALDRKTTTAEGRILALRILHEAGDIDSLFGYADDSSKAVRAVLVDLLPLPGGEWDDAIVSLLGAKKQSVRETAVLLLEKNCPESLRGEIEAALSREKNAGLQTRLAALLGDAAAGTAVAAAAQEDMVKSLTKGSKAKKMDWLFQTAFSPVRMEDGSPADEMRLRALCICYAEQFPLGRSSVADQLAASMHTGDLERFAQEVFARWIALSAPAKTKWVLYLTAIHGGMEAITGFQHYIREWAENARTAIASEAVMALALNGSPAALMAVDNLTRKGKGARVRSTARDALKNAASALKITADELADRIVPDLGFDESGCRVFDFGARQFKVYLTAARELEIYEGDKKLKNLPKPGAKDDPEKSAEAVRAFKEMKKLMKAALELQQKRLEDALKRSRRWTASEWEALFVRKPIMHSFAIGLIWGIYGDSGLTATFRYMEDGTFTTADEEEFELPENAQIGLVHPIELDDAARDAWQEQLSDYEITQPFPQIERPVYRVEEAEREQTQLMRFHGKTINGGTLMGRMERMNWHKGGAQDGGHFYEFLRLDITGSEQQENGRWLDLGYRTELHFSGMYIGAYASQEDVTVESVEFYTPTGRQPLKLGEIDPQYFSEIVCQLEKILSAVSKSDKE